MYPAEDFPRPVFPFFSAGEKRFSGLNGYIDKDGIIWYHYIV